MDFKAAIAKLKTLEVDGAADLVSAIEGEVDRLSSKNFEVIGEKRTATTKLAALESALVAAGKALGIEGDSEALLTDLEPKLKAAIAEATQLKTEKQSLSTRLTDAESKAAKLERSTKVADIAAKAGVNSAVFERLLGDRLDEIAIADDGVKVGDKPLKEFVEGDDGLKPFASALFTTETPAPGTGTNPPKLPSGSPRGETEATDPVAGYMSKAYTGINKLKAAG